MKPARRSRPALIAALVGVLCSGAWVVTAAPSAAGPGALLYREGGVGVVATVMGHDDPLPTEAARCVNCHEGTSAMAPRLTAPWLLEARERRGGPPSSYDEASFCRLLRQGVDPAYVQLPREMPRYQLTDSDCQALWNFLTHR